MQLRTEASHNLPKAPSCTALTHTGCLACFAYHVGVVKNKGPAQVATTEIVKPGNAILLLCNQKLAYSTLLTN